MPKYRVTMGKDGSDMVVVYVEKANAKEAYDAGIVGAALIFGAPTPEKSHSVTVVEQPEL